MGRPGLLTLAVLRVVEGMTKADCVLFLLSEMCKLGIAARVHLLDREFCTVAVMAALESRKARFLMAVAKNAKIARAVAARKRGELGKVSDYTMKSDSGETFTFKLVIIKKMVKVNGKEVRCWKYLTFATKTGRSSASTRGGAPRQPCEFLICVGWPPWQAWQGPARLTLRSFLKRRTRSSTPPSSRNQKSWRHP